MLITGMVACLLWHAAAADVNQVSGGGLLAALAEVPDPRKRRGVRHQMTVILGLAACAVLAGCRSFAAIGEWAVVVAAIAVPAPQPGGLDVLAAVQA